ncbi:MAG: hypothetical protein SYC29_12580 [Planctomycetota bacterium]|nr:hypothetical protein [Planctomycetota bacterium]
MEQRARRANWMKTDLAPDAGMPIIIDYINSELGEDNAIKNAYIGGGYYAGFVIDCDATIIYQANWAWFTPGGQWWGLPLDPVANLQAFLDAYLADPPPCYDGKAGPPRGSVQRGEDDEAPPPGPRAESPTILIVDDDGGSDYEGYFRIPLGNLKLHAETWNVLEDGSPSADLLEEYRLVVWLTGDCSEDTLAAADRAALATYLDGGGKLLLSGQDIGEDIGDSAFYEEYLHAALVDENVGTLSLVGADLLEGVDVALTGIDGANNQDSPSQIALRNGATGVFAYDTGEEDAWAGLRWEGDYRLAYFAFGFEGIGDQGAGAFRFEILERLLAWFDELPPPGDFDGDADVDTADLLFLLAHWGTAFADLDDDEDTDAADLLLLLANWGQWP